MNFKKTILKKFIIVTLLALSILSLYVFIGNKNNSEVVGKIYFNKPVSWEQAFAYLCDEKGKELLGKWPGIELTKEEDYIHSFEVTSKIC